jgi:hypothetical protein
MWSDIRTMNTVRKFGCAEHSAAAISPKKMKSRQDDEMVQVAPDAGRPHPPGLVPIPTSPFAVEARLIYRMTTFATA